MNSDQGQTGARFWRGSGFAFDLSRRALVMGIVNLTPDSFSGDGAAGDAAIAHALDLVRQGADILDVGGESTRPGSDRVDEQTELDRVIPVVEALVREAGVPVSVDTCKAGVAREAMRAGASIVNDISGLRFDAQMADTIAETKAACVVMHILGEPKTMQKEPVYDDLIGEVSSYLAESIRLAEAAGVAREAIAVDPGIGFGKTFDHNLTLLNRVSAFRELGCPVLVGPSRKAFLGEILGGAPPDRRLPGTAAAISCAVAAGADIVRVHDVEFAAGCVKVASAIRRERVSEESE